jgi:hypothetical protein
MQLEQNSAPRLWVSLEAALARGWATGWQSISVSRSHLMLATPKFAVCSSSRLTTATEKVNCSCFQV